MESSTVPNKTTNQATLDTANDFNFTDNKGRVIKFAQIPLSLDIRAGQRDYSYLLQTTSINKADSLDGATEETESKIFVPGAMDKEGNLIDLVRFTMPWLVFPKGWFADDRCLPLGVTPDPSLADTHNVLQGNTRLMLLTDLINENKTKLAEASITGTPESMAAYEANRYHFDAFDYKILTAEEASDPDAVLWYQTSVNDGVKSHTPIELMKTAIARFEFLKSQHVGASDSEVRAMGKKVSQTYGFAESRLYQLIGMSKDLTANPWLSDAVNAGKLTFDTARKLLAAFKKLIKLNAFNEPLVNFFLLCWNDASGKLTGKDAGRAVKITDGTIKTITDSLAKAANVEADVLNTEDADLDGEGDLDNEGEGEGTTKEPKVNRFLNSTAEEIQAELGALVSTLTESLYELASISADTYTADQWISFFTKTEAIGSAIKTVNEKKAKAEADRLLKEEQKTAKDAAKTEAEALKKAQSAIETDAAPALPVTVA